MNLSPIIASDVDNYKKAALRIRAVNHPLRKSFIAFIHDKGEISVTKLYVHFRLEQSVASQHLSILRKARFVTVKKNGKERLYSVNYAVFESFNENIKTILK
jgi:DNA-binding transcriptional ArsR family regulator